MEEKHPKRPRDFNQAAKLVNQAAKLVIDIASGQVEANLGSAKFEFVMEAGLGAGPAGFRNFSLHTFPASRRNLAARRCWTRHRRFGDASVQRFKRIRARYLWPDPARVAYVGVPFVGLIATALAVSELLRRLHGADGVEFASGSALNLEDIECVRLPFSPYAFGHVAAL